MQLLPHSFDWMILIYGLLAGFLSIFISYTLQPGEIFFVYTYILTKWRLKRLNQWQHYSDMKKQEKRVGGSMLDVHKLMLQAAEPHFTWEKGFGMCVICSGFWICLISGIFYTLEPVSLIEIVLIGHVTIRTLKKIYD